MIDWHARRFHWFIMSDFLVFFLAIVQVFRSTELPYVVVLRRGGGLLGEALPAARMRGDTWLSPSAREGGSPLQNRP